MKLYLFFITIILVCGFSQCSSKNETSENSKKDILKVNKFKLRKGKTLKDWNCHEIEDNNICIPSTWKTIEQNKVYYFTYLDNNNDNTLPFSDTMQVLKILILKNILRKLTYN